jgi:hypothetical protein
MGASRGTVMIFGVWQFELIQEHILMIHNEKQNQQVDIQICNFIEWGVYGDITFAWMASPYTAYEQAIR